MVSINNRYSIYYNNIINQLLLNQPAAGVRCGVEAAKRRFVTGGATVVVAAVGVGGRWGSDSCGCVIAAAIAVVVAALLTPHACEEWELFIAIGKRKMRNLRCRRAIAADVDCRW